MNTVAINGRFLARRQTGQERFAKETILELDKIAKKNEYILVVPMEAKETIKLNNIKIVKYGKSKSHLWEQLDFLVYLKKNHMISLNLCTIQPLLAPGYVCIHDIIYKTNPELFVTAYGKLSAYWHRINYFLASVKSRHIFTVTNFSRNNIINYYHVSKEKITVVPSGWDHLKRAAINENAYKEYDNLNDGEYFISIGSLAIHKNLIWVFNAAKVNPDKMFVIVGRASAIEYGVDFNNSNIKNVIMTGYISDKNLMGLLKHSKALIFPSLHEGFGLPPLEALALGKKAIVAKTSCMPEIYGNSVYYLDPYNANVNIDDLMKGNLENPTQLLEKYTNANTAKIINNILHKK